MLLNEDTVLQAFQSSDDGHQGIFLKHRGCYLVIIVRYIVFSFALSALLFLTMFHIIGISTVSNTDTENQGMLQPFIDCIQELSSFDCLNKLEENAKNESDDSLSFVSIDLLRDQLAGGFIFDLIYALLFSCLFVQIYLLLYAIRKKKIHVKYFTLADWAINSAPLLGVLGTIASFVVVVSPSEMQDMQQVFKDNFATAAITTILGGFIYIINLFFLFFINQYFVED